ncbi:hypothetical protein FRC10_010296 [Ceratobasidium sp. 414]|nr:hypothetical protein FRC10_010296 [Ceratobasidium sp. 414]
MANVQPRHRRNIVILCDGTGKNGQRDLAKGQPITNIWRLYQAIQRREGDIVEYFPGVGTDNDTNLAMNLLAQTFGHTAVVSIRKIYMTISHNYRDGDSISLFGYSRGAFIARKVASLIGALGLVTDEAKFNECWESLEHKLPGNRSPLLPLKPRVVPISCLGVWDTVGTSNSKRAVRPQVIREELNLLTLPDDEWVPLAFSRVHCFDPRRSLPEIVQSALHVVAYHENRKLFDVALFNDKKSDKQLCKQTLFPGSHSDVGGGAEEPKGRRNILPDVTLDWMLRNIPQTIQATRNENLEFEVPSWYPIKSAYHDSPLWKRIPDKLYRREHLPKMYGLLRHRTLLGLPSPKSPHLLKHLWRDWEHFNSPVEEANGPPAGKQSLFRRITDKAKSSMTPTWDHPAQPLVPELPPQSADIIQRAGPQVLQSHPALLISRTPRPESGTTDQTGYTTDTLDTISTARTSLASATTPTEFRAWPLTDTPESPAPRRTSLLPITEHAHPVAEKTEKTGFGAGGGVPIPPATSPQRFGSVPGRPASTEPAGQGRPAAQARLGAQVHPGPTQAGTVQFPRAPDHGRLDPAPAPAQASAVSIDPIIRARPSPVQAGPIQVPRAPLPVAQVGSALPASCTPTQARPAPAIPVPTCADFPSIDDVGLTREARPVPVRAYRAVPVSRAPAQTRPAQVDLGFVQADLVQAPAPTRAGPNPAPVQSSPAPVAQPNPAIPVGPIIQAGPVPPAVQLGPTVQFHPAATQVYPTASVGPTVRDNYSPEIRARLAAAQARAPVEAPPTAQTYPTATQAYPSVQVDSVPYAYPNRPRQKKSVMQKIMAFFCCGSSDQMFG